MPRPKGMASDRQKDFWSLLSLTFFLVPLRLNIVNWTGPNAPVLPQTIRQGILHSVFPHNLLERFAVAFGGPAACRARRGLESWIFLSHYICVISRRYVRFVAPASIKVGMGGVWYGGTLPCHTLIILWYGTIPYHTIPYHNV